MAERKKFRKERQEEWKMEGRVLHLHHQCSSALVNSQGLPCCQYQDNSGLLNPISRHWCWAQHKPVLYVLLNVDWELRLLQVCRVAGHISCHELWVVPSRPRRNTMNLNFVWECSAERKICENWNSHLLGYAHHTKYITIIWKGVRGDIWW